VFVIVGVTGGIAAYKTVQLVRLLVLDGHEVHVIPTDDAVKFVGIPTWEAISRHPVTTSVHDDVAHVRHVALGKAADLVVIAPATANFLAKMAAGLADDLLGTSLLATTATVVVAVRGACSEDTCTGASSVMLTRVTVVARGVRLATPSLTCLPYPSLRRGVAGFGSFPKDSNGHGSAFILSSLRPQGALSPPRRSPAGKHFGPSRLTSAAGRSL